MTELRPTPRMIGRRIRAAREKAGRTLAHLACVLGVSPARLYDLEEGRDRPEPLELARLAQVLHESIEFFLDPLCLAGEKAR